MGDKQVLNPCPLTHDPDDIEDLECQSGGLKREDVTPDPAAQRYLIKEEVYCDYKPYGCEYKMQWRRLKVSSLISSLSQQSPIVFNEPRSLICSNQLSYGQHGSHKVFPLIFPLFGIYPGGNV